jgi:hypothetical protein
MPPQLLCHVTHIHYNLFQFAKDYHYSLLLLLSVNNDKDQCYLLDSHLIFIIDQLLD